MRRRGADTFTGVVAVDAGVRQVHRAAKRDVRVFLKVAGEQEGHLRQDEATPDEEPTQDVRVYSCETDVR